MAIDPREYLETEQAPVGIVADDLTGAGDTALQFLAPGADVWILPERQENTRAPAGFSVLALNTESRHALPEDAAARVDAAIRWLKRSGCGRFFKKVDSTLRGNLAVEARQALRTLGYDLAVIAPAFPSAGRQTVGGYQLVDGVPVSVSAYGRDPLSPVLHSHLPTLLRTDGLEGVGHLELREVMAGPEAIASAIVRAVANRQHYMVADAARDEDLRTLARAIIMTPYRVLPVGSAGLARALQPHRLLTRPRPRGHLLGARPPVFVVAGSLNPTTVGQIHGMARGTHVVTLDVNRLLLTEAQEVERLVSAIRPYLISRQDVVLTTGGSEEAGRKGADLGRDLMMDAWQTGHQIAAALGAVTSRLVGEVELSGLILAGGETSLGVSRALGGQPMRVVKELLPAIPLLKLELPSGPLRVVTKSGGFGGPDALAVLVEHLKREGDA